MTIPTRDGLRRWPLVQARRVLVTPAMAAAWLEANDNNRHLRQSVVDFYAREMKAGRWKGTHQGVAFSDLRLIDGQHRLAAIIKSGEPQWLTVFIEEEDDTFGVLDHGKNRSLRDELRRDSRIVEPCTFYCGLASRSWRGHTPAEVQFYVDHLGPALQRLIDVSGTVAKGRTAAPFRAAVALRWLISDPATQGAVEAQWLAWSTLDFDVMNASIKALLKRQDSIRGDGGSFVTSDRAWSAWVAFNPASPDLKKIVIRDAVVTRNDMRSALLRAVNATDSAADPA